jgi:hypothetical protein
MDLVSTGPTQAELALQPAFEHGLMLLEGEIEVSLGGHYAVESVQPGTLLYLGTGTESVELRCASATRLLVLGGEPFKPTPLLWWNFVGRAPTEMNAWAADWSREDGGRFGRVLGYEGPRLSVPPVPRLSRPA